MKKLAVILGIIISINSRANTATLKEEINIKETSLQIKQHVTFPNIIFDLNNAEKVEVVFTTAESGKINFVYAKTNNSFLKEQLEKKFSELVLKQIKSNVAYSIVFNFKQI